MRAHLKHLTTSVAIYGAGDAAIQVVNFALLAVYVKYYGRPKSYWMPAAPTLTLGRTGVLVFEVARE